MGSKDVFLVRAALALEVYSALLSSTETFESDIGADLAYFMGETLKGDKFEAWQGLNNEFVCIFARAFSSTHGAWSYVDLMNDDGVPLPDRIKAAVLDCAVSGASLGNLDEEDYPAAGAWLDVVAGSVGGEKEAG